MNRVKRNVTIIIVSVLLATVLITIAVYYRTVDLDGRVVTVIIKPGDSFGSVAGRLRNERVIPSQWLLSVAARLRGIDKRLVPGRYDFAGRNSCRSVLRRLAEGDFLRVRFTIPEGTPIWEVASIVADSLDLDSAAFVALNQDSAFLEQTGLPCVEGYLFPETYVF
ncbi:MAG: endolytic transglycosylase MltG, partial [Candidatus Zixiibacteriota bacterium]